MTASDPGAPAVGLVDSVTGQWNVPPVTCGDQPGAMLAIWVGLDGLFDATVEQAGTAATCNGSQVSYYAWLETYPDPPVRVPLAVQPGDQVAATVSTSGEGQFLLVLRNLSTGAAYTGRRSSSGRRASAEWVVELARDGARTVIPAGFGSVSFADSTVTIHGQTQPLTDSQRWTSSLTLAYPSGAVRPTALAAAGTAFQVSTSHA